MEGKAVSGMMLTLLMVSMSGMLLTQLPIAEASPLTVLSVDPLSILDPTLGPGSTFLINVTVADVANMLGFEFKLAYDTSVLTTIDSWSYSPFETLIINEIDDFAGEVYMVFLTYFGDAEGFSTTEAAPIAYILFEVDSTGTSVLDLHDTAIVDVWGNSISHEIVDGYFDNLPPPPENWILLATDPDEGVWTSLKAIWGQLYSDVIYFKVEHYWSWTTIYDIDTWIFIDADQNPLTGLPDGYYPGQNNGIGADYAIGVGWEIIDFFGLEGAMVKWDPIAGYWDFDNPILLAYIDAPDNANVFVVGAYLADVETAGALDCAVTDVTSNWDWMPDTGHFTLQLLEIAIYTDKTTYFTGDTMQLGLDIINPGNAVTVCVAIWLEKPDGSIIVIIHAHSVTLPAGLSYSNPAFMSFTLPGIPPGTYTWHAAILDPATHGFLAQDTAEWEFGLALTTD